MTEIEELKARVVRLEAIVKEHLPCPHTNRIRSSFAYGKDFWCEDCQQDWADGEPSPFPSLRIR